MITEPSVHVVSSSRIDPTSMWCWAVFHGVQGSRQFSRMWELWNENKLSDMDFMVEFAGRHCYRSWHAGRDDSKEYIGNVLEVGHGSLFEHVTLTFAIAGVSRTLTHELVRHRVGMAYSQESQRYVDAKDIQFVRPPSFNDAQAKYLAAHCELSRQLYQAMQEHSDESNKKRINESSRSVLPNASETRIVVTCNVRSLRHFLRLRGAPPADLEIKRLAVAMFKESVGYAPFCLQDCVTDNVHVDLGCLT